MYHLCCSAYCSESLRGVSHNVFTTLLTTLLTLKVLVTTIETQWEGMGDVGSARYEPMPDHKGFKLQHFKG